uniref:Uncharacterized protein n=1 Tax=Phocoena sinus TaxID=42100 RepID=A0A8C9CBQ9_PHOSS
VHRWKLLEILLRRPSVQTTCSGQCRCTVVCTLVRLGKGEQRHGQLGTKVAVSEEKTFVCPFFESHIQCFSSQVLHSRDQEALGTLPRKDCSREDLWGSWDLFQRKLTNNEQLLLKLPLDVMVACIIPLIEQS